MWCEAGYEIRKFSVLVVKLHWLAKHYALQLSRNIEMYVKPWFLHTICSSPLSKYKINKGTQRPEQCIFILPDTLCTTEYHIYVTINFNIPHFLHLKQHLPELLGNPAPEPQDLHGPPKIHLCSKAVKLKFCLIRHSSVFEQNAICAK